MPQESSPPIVATLDTPRNSAARAVRDASGSNCESSDDDWARHATLLAASATVLLLSALLHVHEARQVVLPWVGTALPEICGLRNLFGIDCPGCGLTRSFISLAHGDLIAAWRFNPLGIAFFTVLLFQLPLRTFQLARIWTARQVWHVPVTPTMLLGGLSLALIAQWIVRLIV